MSPNGRGATGDHDVDPFPDLFPELLNKPIRLFTSVQRFYQKIFALSVSQLPQSLIESNPVRCRRRSHKNGSDVQNVGRWLSAESMLQFDPEAT
jgi:hypothetical protein